MHFKVKSVVSLFRDYQGLVTYITMAGLAALINFLSVMLLIRWMPIEEYGVLALALSLQGLLTPLLAAGASRLVAISFNDDSVEKYAEFKSIYISLSYRIFLLSLVLIFVVCAFLDLSYIYLLVAFYALFRHIIALESVEYVMERRALKFGLFNIGTVAFSLVLTYLVFIVLPASALTRLSILILTDLIFLVMRYRRKFSLLLSFNGNKEEAIRILRYGAPLLATSLPAWIFNGGDKLIVGNILDSSQLAIYAAGFSIGSVVVTFNSSMSNSIQPEIYKELKSDKLSALRITKYHLKKYGVVSLVFGLSMAIAFSALSELILPSEYIAAKYIVYIFCVSSCIRTFYAVISTVTDYFGLNILRLKSTVLSAAFTAILMTVTVNYFGISGAAISIGLGYLLMAAFLWIGLASFSKRNFSA